MTDSRYRTAVREALDPLVSETGEGPDWDDLTDTASVGNGGRGIPGWMVAGVAALAVLTVVGVPALLSGPFSDGSPVGGGEPPVTVAFSQTEAQETVTQWWSLVLAGDTDAASDLAHPDTEFNYAGLREWVSAVGDTPPIRVDDRTFGSGDQPQLCFALGRPSDQLVGSAVFRTFENQWRLWEIRTNTSGCVAWAESSDASEPDVDSRRAAILAERMAQAVVDMGGFCQRSSGQGDFNGDGTTDLTAIGTADCDTTAETPAWHWWWHGETATPNRGLWTTAGSCYPRDE